MSSGNKVEFTPQPTPIIHVVDDDEAFQVAISRLLKAAGYRVQTYTSVGSFLLSGVDQGPGCILLDLNLPDLSGFELQQAMAARPEPLPIIFLTGYGDIPTSVRAIKAGAVDFLTKPVKRTVLLQAIQNALTRGAETHRLREKLKQWLVCYATLTPRELEVFERVVAGKMNKEIAAELGAAERTIKAHRAQVMEKMRATSLAELVHIADQLKANLTSGATQRPPPPGAPPPR